jgi:hypothetical protein
MKLALVFVLALGCEPAKLVIPLAGAPDANADGDTPDGGAQASCEGVQQTQDSGHHNPGLDCLTCHNGQMPTAPLFKVAGTLYNGGAPVIGGTIRVHTADGQTLKLVSTQNGNFYTSMAVQFPITVEASACPDTQVMPDPITGSSVSCNNCHDAAQRIHLP